VGIIEFLYMLLILTR